MKRSLVPYNGYRKPYRNPGIFVAHRANNATMKIILSTQKEKPRGRRKNEKPNIGSPFHEDCLGNRWRKSFSYLKTRQFWLSTTHAFLDFLSFPFLCCIPTLTKPSALRPLLFISFRRRGKVEREQSPSICSRFNELSKDFQEKRWLQRTRVNSLSLSLYCRYST